MSEETAMLEGGVETTARRSSRGGAARRFRVLVGLNYPTDAAAVRRIMAGEDVPTGARHERRAEPGDIVTDLPASSIPGLLAKGRIEEVMDE